MTYGMEAFDSLGTPLCASGGYFFSAITDINLQLTQNKFIKQSPIASIDAVFKSR